jgi:hypothetical protein
MLWVSYCEGLVEGPLVAQSRRSYANNGIGKIDGRLIDDHLVRVERSPAGGFSHDADPREHRRAEGCQPGTLRGRAKVSTQATEARSRLLAKAGVRQDRARATDQRVMAYVARRR